MRASALTLCLVCATPVAAEDLSGWYARGEGGLAVEVPFGGARVGRALSSGGPWIDVGLAGGEGFADLTAGLEVRAAADRPVSLFTRAEVGGLATPDGRAYAVLSLGAGLAVRLDERWSARAGFTRSLPLGGSVAGRDSVQLGLEHRW